MGVLDTIKKGAKAAVDTTVDFGQGIAKGALDTVASVPRNIKKVGAAALEAKVLPQFYDAIDGLTESNNKLLGTIKKLDPKDPNYGAKKARLNGLIKDNMKMQDQIRANADQVVKDYDEGKINLFGKDLKVNTTVLDKYTQTNNAAERAGFMVEKIGELIVPATSVAKVDKAIKGAQVVNATKLGAGATKVLGKAINPTTAAKAGKFIEGAAKVGNAVARIGGRVALEAVTTAAGSLGQAAYQGRLDTEAGREGAVDEAKKAALTAGALKGVGTVAGEVARGLKLPQKLYARTYKTTDKEMAKLFDNLGDHAGKTLPGDTQTLADWALSKNIKGATKTQAAKVMSMLDESERAVMDTAKNSGVNIMVDPGALATAKSVAEEYADYGKGEVAQKAQNFINSIGEDGAASVEDTIKFRRLLDSLRSKASFRNAKVGDNISYWADELRGQINDIPALGQINKDYAMAMKARDALIAKAKSENNKMILGALEAYTAAMPLMDGAVDGVNGLAGAAVVAAKRIVNSPRYQTSIAQGLNTLGDTTKKAYGMRQVFGKAVASPSTFGIGQDEADFTPDAAEPDQGDLGFTPEKAAAPAPANIKTDYKATKDDLDLGFTAINE